MPDNYENTPVENVAPDTAVADAQSEPVEEVTISAETSDSAQTGAGETVEGGNAAASPADGAQFQSQKDIDAAFGKRIAKVRQQYEQSDAYQLGQMVLNERAQRDGISPAEAYQRIQQERLDAKAEAYARDPKQFYKDLLQGNTPQQQRQPAFPQQETPQAQAQRIGEELADMYRAGSLPQGFDIQQNLDQDTYNNIVEYGAPAAMRIWAAEHNPELELARRRSGPSPMRPTSSNKQSAPTDFSTISSEEYYKKRAEIRKAALDGKRVRLS